LRREVIRRQSLIARVVLIDPGAKIRRLQIGEREQQVGEIALGIDDDRRDAVDRGLLQQSDAEAGLPAARHADTNGMRHQVFGVVQQQIILALLTFQVVLSAQVEDAQLFVILHARFFSSVVRQTEWALWEAPVWGGQFCLAILPADPLSSGSSRLKKA